MGGAASSTRDPALERLHEVAERIRRRAATGRPHRPVAVSAPLPAPPPPPPHWADGPDGPDGGTDETR